VANQAVRQEANAEGTWSLSSTPSPSLVRIKRQHSQLQRSNLADHPTPNRCVLPLTFPGLSPNGEGIEFGNAEVGKHIDVVTVRKLRAGSPTPPGPSLPGRRANDGALTHIWKDTASHPL